VRKIIKSLTRHPCTAYSKMKIPTSKKRIGRKPMLVSSGMDLNKIRSEKKWLELTPNYKNLSLKGETQISHTCGQKFRKVRRDFLLAALLDRCQVFNTRGARLGVATTQLSHRGLMKSGLVKKLVEIVKQGSSQNPFH